MDYMGIGVAFVAGLYVGAALCAHHLQSSWREERIRLLKERAKLEDYAFAAQHPALAQLVPQVSPEAMAARREEAVAERVAKDGVTDYENRAGQPQGQPQEGFADVLGIPDRFRTQ